MKHTNCRKPAFTLCLAAVVAAPWALAETPPMPAGGDSAEYFFRTLQNPDVPARSDASDFGRASPLQLWTGPNDSFLRATVKAQMGYFSSDNAWFGEDEANLGAESDSWWESAITPGLTGSYFTDGGDEVYGRVSVVSTSTEDIDAAGSNVATGDESKTAVEDAYVGWRSGDRFSELGKDFLDISVGRQQYTAGTGFLFYNQSSNGGERGGYWIGERKAADLAAIARISYQDFKADIVYLEADDQRDDDDPNKDTDVTGLTLDYALGDLGGVGGGYYAIGANDEPRDGMDVYDLRFSLTPFQAYNPDSALAPFTVDGEYVYEDNGDALEAEAWYLAGSYGWGDATWAPELMYRYAAFEGDDPGDSQSQDFDPLFYGFNDWGTWYQGEILGEYVLGNSNLNSHTLRLSLDPLESVHVNLFYFTFLLDDAEGFGVSSDDFAEELNLTVDWSATDYLSFSLVGAYAMPDDAAKEYTGGDDDWAYFMVYANFSFK